MGGRGLASRGGAASALAAAAFVAGWQMLKALRSRYVVATVRGPSMLPTLVPGQRVLVRRCPLSDVHTGDLVVLEDRRPATVTEGASSSTEEPSFRFVPPQEPSTVSAVEPSRRTPEWMVKRVVAEPGDQVPRETFWALAHVDHDTVPEGSLVVLGDNPAMSDDSRRYGYAGADWVVGKVSRVLSAPGSDGGPALSDDHAKV